MTTKSSPASTGTKFALLQGILPINNSQIAPDIIAGITLAALAIPEVMGYTSIAKMPVVTGLYTILIPMTLFALFGSSRHLVVGADSATAAVLAAGLAGMAMPASPHWVALAGLLSLMAAAWLFLARLIHLGFIADFLSRTVLIGFLTGVGAQVAIGQIPGMLGISGGGFGPIAKLLTDLKQIPETNLTTVAITLAVLAIILGGKRIAKKFPGPLIAVIGAIVVSYLLGIQSYGVEILGTVPGGLPPIAIPDIKLKDILPLVPVSLSIFILILAQSAATSRAYATKYNEKFNEDIDLVGLGLSSLGAGLSGTFVVNGSPTKTQMVDSAGGRTQLAQITTSLIVLIVLLFLTAPLAFMPQAVLSTIVFLVGIELIDIKGMRTIYIQRRAEFWVALITAITVVGIGVEEGILLAVVLSIVVHTRHGYHPSNRLLIMNDGDSGHIQAYPVETQVEALPGLILYRFGHSIYYANTTILTEEITKLTLGASHPPKWFCIDFVAIDDVDFSAAASLRDLYHQLNDHNVKLVFCEVSTNVLTELDISGITELIGIDAIFSGLDDVVLAYKNSKIV